MNPSRKKLRIGDLLVANRLLTQEQLQTALGSQKQSGKKLGQLLIDQEHISEPDLLSFLSRQLKIPYVDLKQFHVNPKIAMILSEAQARRYNAIILDNRADGLIIGMSDPTDLLAYDALGKVLKRPIRLAVISERCLIQTIDRVYRKTDAINNLAIELGEEFSDTNFDLNQLTAGDDVADAPVVKMVQSIFEDAVQMGASDIHIEPDENLLRVRQRLDGILQEQIIPGKQIAGAVVSRLKLISGLDISEKRIPQDGRFNMEINHRVFDVRLSTLPIQHGESVVMRLLAQDDAMRSLDQLGMAPDIQQRFQQLIQRPHGVVLVTGPTGSGKTTTLYAGLNLINTPGRKVITVEDPVEYRIPRLNQVQINVKAGLSFAKVLRSCLRQDPDVILVGEMRDQETAEIGLRAAMTGHLVLSTLHTNDAINTPGRLIDMGAEPFLVATALQAILAQRLIRKLCDNCKRPLTLEPQQQSWLEGFNDPDINQAQYFHGEGCPECNQTGYRGRLPIHELLEIDKPLADLLKNNDSIAFAQAARQQAGFKPLMQAALTHAMAGRSSIDEVLRIAGDVQEH